MVNNYKTINDRIRQLEKTVDSFRASDDAWEEEREFYRWCDTEDYKEIIKRLDSLEQKQKECAPPTDCFGRPYDPKTQHPSMAFTEEFYLNKEPYISLDFHKKEIEKKDKTIRAHEQRINALVDDMKRNRIMIEQFKKLMNDTTLQ